MLSEVTRGLPSIVREKSSPILYIKIELNPTNMAPPLEDHEVTYGENKKIFYHASGPSDGPLLIFVHGWPAIGKLWKPQMDAFSSMGFRCVAPDMPGVYM